MVSEARKQSMAWMETDYSKHTHFRWKIKWRLEHLGRARNYGWHCPFEESLVGGNCCNTIQIHRLYSVLSLVRGFLDQAALARVQHKRGRQRQHHEAVILALVRLIRVHPYLALLNPGTGFMVTDLMYREYLCGFICGLFINCVTQMRYLGWTRSKSVSLNQLVC